MYEGSGSSATTEETATDLRAFLHHRNQWTYEIDLQLAAELGKTLLQRNKELEKQLASYQDLAEDQALEIEFLTKQVGILRDEGDTRLAACEMLESQLQELKKSETNLQDVRNLDYMRINRLQDTVEVLQTRSEELQSQLIEVKRKHWELKSSCTCQTNGQPQVSSGMTRSVSHGEALKSASRFHDSDSEDEPSSEVTIMKEKIDLLQREVNDHRKQNSLLHSQNQSLISDNSALWTQMDHLSKEAKEWRDKLDALTTKYSEEINQINQEREKPDCPDLRPDSAMTTQLSILDEIADSLRDRFMEDFKREQTDNENQEEENKMAEEVDVNRPRSRTTQTDTTLMLGFFASDATDPIQGRFERGPPEYKKLFREIFEIIKRSQEEEASIQSKGRSKGKRPKKVVIDYYNQF